MKDSLSFTPAWRVFSAIELVTGAAIVIGHNVYHVVPNEVPILFVIGLLSVRLRDGRWSAIGFKRPESWKWIVLIALFAAVLRVVLGNVVIEPLATHFWPPIHPPAGAEHITGNLKLALLYLLIVWTFAAFGEEICTAVISRSARRTSAEGPALLTGSRRSWCQCCLVTVIIIKDQPGFSIRA